MQKTTANSSISRSFSKYSEKGCNTTTILPILVREPFNILFLSNSFQFFKHWKELL